MVEGTPSDLSVYCVYAANNVGVDNIHCSDKDPSDSYTCIMNFLLYVHSPLYKGNYSILYALLLAFCVSYYAQKIWMLQSQVFSLRRNS